MYALTYVSWLLLDFQEISTVGHERFAVSLKKIFFRNFFIKLITLAELSILT